jgi:autophagy-related protein 5
MANDREVLKVVWEGKVPVKFIADEDKDLEDMDAFFLLIPRVSYLPLVTDKVK